MKEEDRLLVFWGERPVGALKRHSQGRLVFQYDQHWLKEDKRPVSLSLPCQTQAFPPAVSTAFFENLLPESRVRTVLAFNHRFDEKDIFSFLKHFGEDCAGALSIIEEKRTPDFTPGQYECIDTDLKEALGNIQADPDRYSLFSQMENARLSIAGAQDKLSVYRDEHGSFFLPSTSGSATTHIIKPINPRFEDLPRNEAFCMKLAETAELPVPNSQLVTVGGHELFVVDRYDRQRVKETVLRIHQEDLCQAMGLPARNKYQENGGPGFGDCRQLIDEHLPAQSVAARTLITKIMIFNFIIGNHDAHGKNFSLIHETDIRLAPFYDLVCTQAYPVTNKFAMAIGNTFRHDRIKAHAIAEFARHMNFRKEKVSQLMEHMFLAVNNSHQSLLAAHEKQYGSSRIYAELGKVIHKNLSQLEGLLQAMSKKSEI